MKTQAKVIVSHFTIFVLGVIAAFILTPALNFGSELLFGFEICSRASFPFEHMAKVRTRPGFGDQTLFFEVDNKDVWRSGDMPPGDLGEDLSWDVTGKIVTLKLQEQSFIRYDTELKRLVEIEDREPLRLR